MKVENVSVFISSTFNDMHAEREFLLNYVFPKFRQWCEERDLILYEIDLRWGISEAQAQNNKNVVDTCLENVKKSDPIFLCFIGQRRGWIPTLDRRMEKYQGYSITELEIEQAVFHSILSDDREKEAIFFFRDGDFLKDVPENIRPIFDENEYEENRAKIGRLREKLTAKGFPICDYRGRWKDGLKSNELRHLGEKYCNGRLQFDPSLAEEILKELTSAVLRRYPERAMVERDASLQDGMVALRANEYLPVDDSLQKILAFIGEGEGGRLIVKGGSGSGKTTLICKVLETVRNENTVYRLLGNDGLEGELVRILTSMGANKLQSNLHRVTDYFVEYVNGREENLVLILDNVDKDLEQWLDLLSRVDKKVVCTTRSTQKTPSSFASICLGAVRDNAVKESIVNDYLGGYLKGIDGEILKKLVANDDYTPLDLKIILYYLLHLTSNEAVARSVAELPRYKENYFRLVLDELHGDEYDPLYVRAAEATLGMLSVDPFGVNKEVLIKALHKTLGCDVEEANTLVNFYARKLSAFIAQDAGALSLRYEQARTLCSALYLSDEYKNALCDAYKEYVGDFENVGARDAFDYPKLLIACGRYGEADATFTNFAFLRAFLMKQPFASILDLLSSYDSETSKELYDAFLLLLPYIPEEYKRIESGFDYFATQLYARLRFSTRNDGIAKLVEQARARIESNGTYLLPQNAFMQYPSAETVGSEFMRNVDLVLPHGRLVFFTRFAVDKSQRFFYSEGWQVSGAKGVLYIYNKNTRKRSETVISDLCIRDILIWEEEAAALTDKEIVLTDFFGRVRCRIENANGLRSAAVCGDRLLYITGAGELFAFDRQTQTSERLLSHTALRCLRCRGDKTYLSDGEGGVFVLEGNELVKVRETEKFDHDFLFFAGDTVILEKKSVSETGETYSDVASFATDGSVRKGSVKSLLVKDDRVYTASDKGELCIDGKLVCRSLGSVVAMAREGDRLFVTTENDRIGVYDLTLLTNARSLFTRTEKPVVHAEVVNGYLLLFETNGGVSVCDKNTLQPVARYKTDIGYDHMVDRITRFKQPIYGNYLICEDRLVELTDERKEYPYSEPLRSWTLLNGQLTLYFKDTVKAADLKKGETIGCWYAPYNPFMGKDKAYYNGYMIESGHSEFRITSCDNAKEVVCEYDFQEPPPMNARITMIAADEYVYFIFPNNGTVRFDTANGTLQSMRERFCIFERFGERISAYNYETRTADLFDVKEQRFLARSVGNVRYYADGFFLGGMGPLDLSVYTKDGCEMLLFAESAMTALAVDGDSVYICFKNRNVARFTLKRKE